MIFGFLRRQQEKLIDERMELLREEIEDMLNTRGRQVAGRTEEQIRKGAEELRFVFDQRLGEISLGLERIMASVPNGMANRETMEELKRDLKQSRAENQQLIKQMSQLILAIGALNDSVKEIQERMEKPDQNSAQMTSMPLVQYPYQIPFPPVTKAPVSWPVSGGGQISEQAPISTSAPQVPKQPGVGEWNPETLDGRNGPDPSRAVSEAAVTAEDFVHVSAPAPVLSPVFTEDFSENKQALAKCMIQCTKLGQTLEQACGTDESLNIYRRLLDKCQKKLESLSKKMDEKRYDPEKLASEVVKVFGQSVVKGLSQESVSGLMGDFLAACGLRKIRFKPGQKLTDRDYEYVDDLIFYEEVDKEAMNNCIIAIRQDAYVLDYTDENGPGEAVIPGSYKIGKYKG